MAIPFLSPIDMFQNELRNARIHVLAADPSTPVSGQIWYNSTSNRLKYYDGAVKTIAILTDPLSSFAVPTASLNLNSQTIQNLGTPVNSTDAATKGYVDGLALGLDIKASVRVTTTAAGTLSTSFANGQTVDGIAIATGDRILIKNQVTASENGIYVVAASGAPARSSDFNSSTNMISGAFCFVEQGTTNAGSSWVVSTQGTITPGTTGVTFVQFSAVGTTYSAGSGLTLTGTVFSVNVTGTSTEISGGNVRVKSSSTAGQPLLSQGAGVEANYGQLNLAGAGVTGTLPVANGGTAGTTAATARTALGATTKFAQSIGDGAATSIVVTHNLGTQDVVAMLYTNASPFQQPQVEIQITSTNTITIVFASAPASNAYRVVVIG